ncbi:MAG: NAD-dependent epimerase/dehydratase family protein [Alphaproteobacteria bacterium]|nr:NAD-dependent epimerase/dehydratase family protein [Alphaproteobacteria bacterium]
MTILVTGAAGFIGYHVSEALIARGEAVIGVDNMNDYYDAALKEARLARLETHSGFVFERADISDEGAMVMLARRTGDVTGVVHLAAQAGVRYSLLNPHAYVRDNIVGHLNILEMCRGLKGLKHLVYASSSSVYGGNEKLPYAESDPVDRPVSLYAASKKSDELISHTYSHLHGIPATGLRFFTVYGPWGRPDMAYYLFTESIFRGETIHVFNHGDMRRDFTYIDDVVAGVLAALDRPPRARDGAPPHRIYNIGNHRAEELLHFIGVIEEAVGRKAELKMAPMQPGDVKETYADIELARRDLGFDPVTQLDVGIPLFVQWYRDYHGH